VIIDGPPTCGPSALGRGHTLARLLSPKSNGLAPRAPRLLISRGRSGDCADLIGFASALPIGLQASAMIATLLSRFDEDKSSRSTRVRTPRLVFST
jgi:hypothetical protein